MANSAGVAALAAEGQKLISLGRVPEALNCFRTALGEEPANPRLHLLVAWALAKKGAVEADSCLPEAETHLRQAIALDPSLAVAHGMLGFRLQERGQFQEAIDSFKRAVALDPRQAGAYYGIAQSKRLNEEDRPLVERMETLLEAGGLAPNDQEFLHYGLGKACDDLGFYEAAMRHFDEANRLCAARARAGYDRDGNRRFVDRCLKFRLDGEPESQSELPILIVGMPRSGTTLVEQVLSSHPDVAAGGELPFWRDAGRAARTANLYLRLLTSIRPNAKRVTDKMPLNYLFLGPIHQALPSARIVHCRRHPVDTCLSIYMTRIEPPQFGGERASIVFGYHQYLRLMEHWRILLPADRFFEIDYEALVEDRETQTRRLIEFCGLEWRDACLRPEQNPRAVRTPSFWQARQPVYGTSIGRWKRYEPWLDVFKELL